MIIPYPPWQPDLATVNGQFTQTAQNVLPRADGYGPWKDYAIFSGALPATCRGFFRALNSDGTVSVFAGTSTKLYKMDNTTLLWTDVSLGAGSYTALPTGYHWQFCQFGNLVLAVQPNVAPQTFTLGVSSAFAALAGSPPQAAYIANVNRFVVLTGLNSFPFRIQWSDLGDATNWSTGVSGSQDFPDGGLVRGVAGGEYGIVFQDTVIRRLIYQPGSTTTFAIEKVTEDMGLLAPYSIVKAGTQILFLSQQGFKMMGATGIPAPVGKEKIDRTFFADYDSSSLQLILGASDPDAPRVYWTYRQQSGPANLFNRIVCYDYVLDKWTLDIAHTGEFLANLAAPGATLESLDSLAPGGYTISAAAYNGAPFNQPGWPLPQRTPVVGATGSSGDTPGATPFKQSSWPLPSRIGVPGTITISGATASGDGKTRLTVSAIPPGNRIEIYNVTGGLVAGNYYFDYQDPTHIILPTVTFVSTGTGSIGGSMDALTFSFDDIALSALPKLAAFDSAHKLNFFTGAALEATVDTQEQQLDQARRVRVRGFRVLTDAATVYGSVGTRETTAQSVVYSTEQLVTDTGVIPANVSTRLARSRARIPSQTWTSLTGVEPDFVPDGLR